MESRNDLPWRVMDLRTLVSDRWLRLESQRVATGRGAILDPYYVILERNWSTAIPVLPDGRLVAVEQYRHGAQRWCIEFPAGDIDGDEDPAIAAVRELSEETGYQATGPAIPLGRLMPEPARNRSVAHGYLVPVSASPGTPDLDAGEDIRVSISTIAQILAAARDGRFCHAVQLAFLHQAISDGLLPPPQRV